MNSVIKAINNRRSIRAYEPKPIPKDIINKIIEAGNLAPSTGDTKERRSNPQTESKKDYLLSTGLLFLQHKIKRKRCGRKK
jgi:nitroreductase